MPVITTITGILFQLKKSAILQHSIFPNNKTVFKMKKIKTLAAIVSLLFSITVTAQQNAGIGTNTPNASAMLDITSANKGLLIPRVNLNSLTDAATIASPANALMIFNTNTALPGGAGFYFNSGTAVAPVWSKLQTAAAGWSVTGNAGTDSLINFLGTTDNKPIVFRVNNGFAGQLGSNGGISFGRGANGKFRNTSSGVIAIGDSALFNNPDSSEIAIGNGALYNNNNAFAGGLPSIGDNVAIGNASMLSNLAGNRNVAVGHYTLSTNDSGIYNIAIGYGALNFSRGSENTSIGAYTMVGDSSGFENTAIGSQALTNNYTGFENTGIGARALLFCSSGTFNTAAGYQALNGNISGTRNTAVGINAMLNNNSGSFNTAMGRQALLNNVGNGNTAVGNKALTTLAGGSFNTAIGDSADCINLVINNSTAIGFQASITASNSIVLGNTSIVSIKGQVGFSTFSDGRYKKDIVENVSGLNFIMQLRPVTYHYDFVKIRAERNGKDAGYDDNELVKYSSPLTRQLRFAKNNNATLYNSVNRTNNKPATNNFNNPALAGYYEEVKKNDQIRYTGFIAQEVEAAANKTGFDFSGVDKPKNDQDQYALRYAEFVVPLVKAVQEQQAIIDEQNKKIEDLSKRLEKLEPK